METSRCSLNPHARRRLTDFLFNPAPPLAYILPSYATQSLHVEVRRGLCEPNFVFKKKKKVEKLAALVAYF